VSLLDAVNVAAGLLVNNIPGLPLAVTGPIPSVRDNFLSQLEVWYTSIPMSTQWVVFFEFFPAGINTSLIQGLERTNPDGTGFDIDAARNILTQPQNQNIFGCIFASSITIPSESFSVESVSVQNNRGFLPGIIAGGRTIDPPTLDIQFRDTNVSFIDMVIRPWVILTSHFGLVARPGDTGIARDLKNVKTNIHVMQYTRTQGFAPQLPRKLWTFYNCAPFNVSEETLEYTEEKVQYYNSRWTYSNYTVSSNTGNSALANIITALFK